MKATMKKTLFRHEHITYLLCQQRNNALWNFTKTLCKDPWSLRTVYSAIASGAPCDPRPRGSPCVRASWENCRRPICRPAVVQRPPCWPKWPQISKTLEASRTFAQRERKSTGLFSWTHYKSITFWRSQYVNIRFGDLSKVWPMPVDHRMRMLPKCFKRMKNGGSWRYISRTSREIRFWETKKT